jgi:hypothetical protein
MYILDSFETKIENKPRNLHGDVPRSHCYGLTVSRWSGSYLSQETEIVRVETSLSGITSDTR